MFHMCSLAFATAYGTKGQAGMGDNGSVTALAIICGWEWEGYSGWGDYSQYGPITGSLSDAVNKLAFEGHPDAAGAMLSLLADGRIVATGDYRWQAFRNEHYRNEGAGVIPMRHWQAVQACLAAPPMKGGKYTRVIFSLLDGLDDENGQPAAEWKWSDNGFSSAQACDPKLLFDDGYFEEFFCGRNIEVSPAAGEPIVPECTQIGQKAESSQSKGGAPRQYNWEGAVAAVVFRWAEEGSWQPETQADVKRALAEWFARDDLHPSDTELKKRAQWLFAEFRQRAGEVDNLAA